jgi:hypothetical protein
MGNVDNTTDANKPVSTAQQTVLDGKVDKVTGKGLSTEDYSTAEKTKHRWDSRKRQQLLAPR